MHKFSRAFTALSSGALALAGAAYAFTPSDTELEPPVLGPAFSVVLSTTGSGIRASCESGCGWETIAAEYPSGEYVITSTGVQAAAVAGTGPEEAGFDFRLAVEDAGKEVRARCEQGCRWLSVSGKSPVGTYRITEHGIEPLLHAARYEGAVRPNNRLQGMEDRS